MTLATAVFKVSTLGYQAGQCATVDIDNAVIQQLIAAGWVVQQACPSPSSGPTGVLLASLGDVTLSSPASGDLLSFDTPSSRWKNKSGSSQTLDALKRTRKKLATDPANLVIDVYGDSTAEILNYPTQFTELLALAGPGLPLQGMTADAAHIRSRGNSGVSLTAYLAGGVGTAGHQLADFQASTADLIGLRWLSNDARLGARTEAQMEADLRTLLGLAPAGADIIVTVPPTFTTTVVGTDFLAGATTAQAQARWDAARAACLAVAGDYPHVYVFDPSVEIYGTRVAATSALMIDQLHPNAVGQALWADAIARLIGFSRPTLMESIAPSGYPFEVLGSVTASGNGFIDVDCLDTTRLPRGVDWPLLAGDFLYIPGFATFPLQLTGATFSPSGNSIRILKAGTDFSAVAATTLVAIVGTGPRVPFVPYRITARKATLAYSSTMTPDASAADYQTVTITNNTAFTVANPTNEPNSGRTQDLTIAFKNSSGGAITNLGLATWQGHYVLTGGALPNPANGTSRFIRFAWDGTVWVEQYRSPADY